jgi:hypothetical protein
MKRRVIAVWSDFVSVYENRMLKPNLAFEFELNYWENPSTRTSSADG